MAAPYKSPTTLPDTEAPHFDADRVVFESITKSYGGRVVCDAVSCEFRFGEIHALVGQNGAGKSTLMKILAGVVQPDAGRILIRGERADLRNPRSARAAGIGMMQQHFSLIDALSVAENLALTSPEEGAVFSPWRWRAKLDREAQRLGFAVRPEARAGELSVGERQRVEIFRLLLQNAKVLILDEPTSVISPVEAERLFAQLRALAEAGHAVIVITHKLNDALRACDRVTVLRRGRIVLAGESADLDLDEITRGMLGDLQRGQPAAPRCEAERVGAPIVEARGLSVAAVTSRHGISGLDLVVKAGEILGVGGLSGSGQEELAAAVFGTLPYEGEIRLHRCDALEGTTPSFIPADGSGWAKQLTVEENLVAREYGRSLSRRGWLADRAAWAEFSRRLVEEHRIALGHTGQPLSTLSGGNRQKVLLARELERCHPLLIAVNPTAGLDVAAREYVHHRLRAAADEGRAVLLISDDLDELALVADRAMILYEGKNAGVFEEPAAQIGAMAHALIGRKPA